MNISKLFKPEDFKLCYLTDIFAYFTTQELSKQWGDDWDDAPYEHNAGEPYKPCWHNEPNNLNYVHRGPVEPGELCKGKCCIDDWNDDGTPKWEILKIVYEISSLCLPNHGCNNSDYSVESINSKRVPWLYSLDGKEKIYAGTTLKNFINKINELGGQIYYPTGWLENHET